MKFEWEEIWYCEDHVGHNLENVYLTTYRSKVIGGWLIRHETLIDAERQVKLDGWSNAHNSISFIPDPKHEWNIE